MRLSLWVGRNSFRVACRGPGTGCLRGPPGRAVSQVYNPMPSWGRGSGFREHCSGDLLDALRAAERSAGAKRMVLSGSGGGMTVRSEIGSPRLGIAVSSVRQMPGSSEAAAFACSGTCRTRAVWLLQLE